MTGDNLTTLPPDAIRQARLPPRFGGLGLRDAVRTSTAAYFASFADILPSLQSRYPQILAHIRNYLQASPDTRSQTVTNLDELESCRNRLLTYLDLPDWDALIQGARPPVAEPDEIDPGQWQHGWQFHTSNIIEEKEYLDILQTADNATKARLRSCRGRNNSR